MYRLSHLINEGELNQPLLETVGKAIYYSTGLSVSLINRQNQRLYHLGAHHFMEELFPDAMTDYVDFVKEQLINTGNGVCIYDTEYAFSYICMLITDSSRFLGSVITGPFGEKPVDEHQINTIISSKKLPMGLRDQFKSFYSNLPILSSSRSYFVQQSILGLFTNSHIEELFPIRHMKDLSEDIIKAAPALDLKKTEHNYPLEVLFLTKVKNGDLEKVVDLYNEHIKTQYLHLTNNNPLRTSKNKALTFSTLLARAIIDGGVENDRSLALEESISKKIEQTKDLSQLAKVIESMVIQYTNMVLQLSSINHVSVIKNASKYVHQHLSEPIRLNDVAGYVNLSPNYFSSLFKREMNLSFADYVNQTRIKESQYLLETTEYSILDIALSVGYNNQNYFTTIFRKFTGITPKQYRMRSAK